jgi:hypothetical protein
MGNSDCSVLPDPRDAANAPSWDRMRDWVERPPTPEEMVEYAKKHVREEAVAVVAAMRNHLILGTQPPPAISEFIVEALTKIVNGEDANLALRVKVKNAPRRLPYYRKKAASAILQLVAQGMTRKEAAESIAKLITEQVSVRKGTKHAHTSWMLNDEIDYWAAQVVTVDLVTRCYDEYYEEMLLVLKGNK